MGTFLAFLSVLLLSVSFPAAAQSPLPEELGARRARVDTDLKQAPAGGLVGHRDRESIANDGRVEFRGGTWSGGPREKTVGDGLYMDGRFTYLLSGGVASITLDRINNDSFTRTTGTLRLELWASASAPSRGGGFTGYRLVVFNTFSPLPPRTYYFDITRSAPYVPPPDGTYWLVLVLTEYDDSCARADGFCQEDSFISDTTVRFGAVAPPRYNYSDMWWNSSESGWGVALIHHPTNKAFAAWYTYDSLGVPYWYVAPDCPFAGDSCTSTLYETTGPPFGPNFNPALVTARSVGSVTFSFSSQNGGTMAWSVRGTAATKFITRQSF